MAGFYRHHLHGRDGWRVRAQSGLEWGAEAPSPGLADLLPGTRTDVILERGDRGLVIDTKFTGVLTRNQFDNERFKSGHIYQMYAYLRSQEGQGPLADGAAGLLLYPALRLQAPLTEAASLHGHRLTFATIDLADQPQEWGKRLIELAAPCSH